MPFILTCKTGEKRLRSITRCHRPAVIVLALVVQFVVCLGAPVPAPVPAQFTIDRDVKALRALRDTFHLTACRTIKESWIDGRDPCTAKPMWANIGCTLGSNKVWSVTKLDLLNSDDYLACPTLTHKFNNTVPKAIGNLVDLRWLRLSGRIEGVLPDEIGHLTKLTHLDLRYNKMGDFRGIPPSIGRLVNLESLYLGGNKWVGDIPDLSSLKKLKHLQLSGEYAPDMISVDNPYGFFQQLSGPVPSWLNSLTNLEVIDLSFNQLTGDLPDLSALQKLKLFDVMDNFLTGEIPSTMGSLSSLESLNLRGNRLTGGIPASFANLTSLTTLRLAGVHLTTYGSAVDENGFNCSGQLTGSVPGFLATLPKLTIATLNCNQFSGSVPDEFGVNPDKWQLLDLSWNQLSGVLPGWVESRTRYIKMDGRQKFCTQEYGKPCPFYRDRTGKLNKGVIALIFFILLAMFGLVVCCMCYCTRRKRSVRVLKSGHRPLDRDQEEASLMETDWPIVEDRYSHRDIPAVSV